MALSEGTRLGVYEVTAKIGEGGMGEVYKTTDTRLDRTVAVKVLPEHVASDPDLMRRRGRLQRLRSSQPGRRSVSRRSFAFFCVSRSSGGGGPSR